MDRKIIFNQINQISNENKAKFSLEICNKIIELECYKRAKSIFIYKALDNEVCLDKLIDDSLDKGKIVAVPITRQEIHLIKIDKTTQFEKKLFDVREPTFGEEINDVDLAIVPMVAFDKNCNRVGHGKGYYDRFLAKHKCIKIGVAFEMQQIINCEVKSTDVAMDMIITEKSKFMNKLSKDNCNKF
ncbi:MAG: 5-formyltetrahydrofolate cyclo-ligase [Clostridia bacterium]